MREHSATPSSPDSAAISGPQPAAQLEELWRQGQQPRVRDFLAGAAWSLTQVVAVLAVDQRQRWQRGEHVPAEEYLQLYPRLAVDAEKALELIYGEFLLREALGETPDVEEYVRRFPTHATRLRQQVQLHRALACPASQSDSFSVSGDVTSGDGTPTATSAPTSAGTGWPQVPGYEILGELGRGGMGVVYQARQLGLNRLVALKMLRLGEDARPDQLTRFAREAEAVAQLQHSHIVQIHEVGHQDGRPYFALEYMDGGSLDKKLAGKPQVARLAARLVETLARAMHAAHQHHIVHRDLKPANVLLSGGADTPLEQCTPKITDFGLAKRLDVDLGQTQSGVVMGTPPYMAPEQARGLNKQVGPAADVYALGAILYELLTGRPPFQGENVLDTLQHVVSRDPVAPHFLQPKVPRDLETICLKCLAKEPRRRYGSAEAFAEDLRRFLAGKPILARPVPRWERSWKWGRRHPAAAALIGVSILAVLGLFAGGWFFGMHERQRANEIEGLRRDTSDQRDRADERAKVAQRRLAENYLDRGLALCAQGNETHGVLWLHRALMEMPAEAQDLERTIRCNLSGWGRSFHALQGILPHEKHVESVIMGPDGQTVLTGGGGQTRRWEAKTGRPLKLVPDPEGSTSFLSPDGQSMVIQDREGTARLWQVGTGQPLGPPLHLPKAIQEVVFSPDGKTVLIVDKDRTPRLLQMFTGQSLDLAGPHGTPIHSTFSPDGKALLTGTNGKTALLWEAATGKLLRSFEHQARPQWVAFSPDGQTVLTGSDDGAARLWEAATGKPLGQSLHHQGPIRVLAFSSDGKTVLTGSADRTARLWEAGTGKPRGPYLPHQDPIFAAAFSPDDKTVLTGSYDKTVRLWEVDTGRPLGPPLHHQSGITYVGFSLDGKTVLTGSDDNTARLWQVNTDKSGRLSLPHRGWVYAVAFSPDGKTLLTGANRDGARLWQMATRQPLGPVLQGGIWIMTVAFSPDGKTILTGGWDRTARLWEASTGRPLGPPFQHQDVVNATAFSPDGKTVLTGSHDRTAQLWDVNTGQRLGPPLRHQGPVFAVAFSPDGKTVLTGSTDHTAQLWTASTGQPVGPPLRHQGSIYAVAFSPDGQTVLTGSEDETAQRWAAATGQPLGLPLHHQEPVRAVAFSPDGQTVLTGSADGTAQLWTVAGQPLGPPLRHRDSVLAAAFSPDGKTVLTGSKDRTARLWEVPQALQGTDEHIGLWLAVLTGLELGKDGRVHVLDAETWQKYRRDLEAEGSPRLP
jgi:WD40 repeat protein